jgi:hypothetical protein
MLVDRFFVEVLEFFFYQKIHLHLKLLFYKYINFTLKYILGGILLYNEYENGGSHDPKNTLRYRMDFFSKKPGMRLVIILLSVSR